MKKGIKYAIILFLVFFSFSVVRAENKTVKCYDEDYTFDDSSQAVYCGHLKNSGFLGVNKGYKGGFVIDKEDVKEKSKDSNIVYFNTGISFSKLSGEKNITVQLVTFKSDPVLNEKNKWWKSLLFCKSNSASHGTADLYTDSLTSNTSVSKGLIDFANCDNFVVKGISEENIAEYCPVILEQLTLLYENGNSYKSTGDSKYATKYKDTKEKIRTLCNQVSKFADYSDSCISGCLGMDAVLSQADETFALGDKGECGFSGRLIAWILNILSWIKYIIPVVVILFGIIDFIKATGSEKDDAMKKAQANFVKRLIAAALIFLVPSIIEFILPKFGFDYNSCGIFK